MAKPNTALMTTRAKTKVRNLLRGKPGAQQAETYVEKICKAIATAWETWRLQAKFKDLKVTAVSATGPPGCLDGPSWESLIKAQAPQSNTWEKALTNAISSALSESVKTYEKSVTVTGLPWYPAFAAWPGPMAPPTANVPSALGALPHNRTVLSADNLKTKIKNKASGSPQHLDQIAEAVALGFNMAFMLWLPTQMIVSVLGKGPVPSFGLTQE